MTANGSKSYLPYLNKLEEQYNNIYHHSINKKLELLSIKIFLVQITIQIRWEKYLLSIQFWKLILDYIINELLSRTRQSY